MCNLDFACVVKARNADVEETLMEISDLISNSNQTDVDLVVIAGSLDSLADAVERGVVNTTGMVGSSITYVYVNVDLLQYLLCKY